MDGGREEEKGNRWIAFILLHAIGLREMLYHFKTYFVSSSQTSISAGNEDCSFSSN